MREEVCSSAFRFVFLLSSWIAFSLPSSLYSSISPFYDRMIDECVDVAVREGLRIVIRSISAWWQGCWMFLENTGRAWLIYRRFAEQKTPYNRGHRISIPERPFVYIPKYFPIIAIMMAMKITIGVYARQLWPCQLVNEQLVIKQHDQNRKLTIWWCCFQNIPDIHISFEKASFRFSSEA